MNIAIIPARGGSKRIPRKNLKLFNGKPIIAYSIEAALKSGLFSKVMVSTDDKEIVQIAKKYGAEVPFLRSEKNSDDFASTAAVIEEVLAEYSKLGINFQNFCCIYPTAPLIHVKTLIEAFQKLINGRFDTVFPIVEFSYPPLRCLVINNESVKMKFPEYLNSRSQDLEKMFHDAGQFYWGDVAKFLSSKKLFSANSSFVKLDNLMVQDIDNMDDWKIAELKFKYLNNL